MIYAYLHVTKSIHLYLTNGIRLLGCYKEYTLISHKWYTLTCMFQRVYTCISQMVYAYLDVTKSIHLYLTNGIRLLACYKEYTLVSHKWYTLSCMLQRVYTCISQIVYTCIPHTEYRCISNDIRVHAYHQECTHKRVKLQGQCMWKLILKMYVDVTLTCHCFVRCHNNNVIRKLGMYPCTCEIVGELLLMWVRYKQLCYGGSKLRHCAQACNSEPAWNRFTLTPGIRSVT